MLAARLLRDRRRSTLWWTTGMAALVVFTVALYPTVKGQASIDQLTADMPEALRSMFGLDEAVPLSSPAGYLHGRLFSLMLPLVLVIFGVGLGAHAIGGSEENGTLELLLANPVTRRRVACERYVAMVTLLGVLTVAFIALLLVLAPPFDVLDGVSSTGAVGASLGAFGLALVHATVAFAVGAASGRRGAAIAVAGVVAITGYLLQAFAQASGPLHPLRFLSPWHWYLGRNMLVHGVAPDALVLPLLVAAVLVAVAVATFEHRDLR
jgi:ABC-2 type transport system permease protein